MGFVTATDLLETVRKVRSRKSHWAIITSVNLRTNFTVATKVVFVSFTMGLVDTDKIYEVCSKKRPS